MAISILSGSRRVRLFFIAILQGVLLLSLVYWYSPLVTGPRNDAATPEWHKTAEANKNVQESISPDHVGSSDVPEWALPPKPTPTPTPPTAKTGAESESTGLVPGVSVVEEPEPASTTPVQCVNFEMLQ